MYMNSRLKVLSEIYHHVWGFAKTSAREDHSMAFPLFAKIMEELRRERLLQSSISSGRTMWPSWVTPTAFDVRICWLCKGAVADALVVECCISRRGLVGYIWLLALGVQTGGAEEGGVRVMMWGYPEVIVVVLLSSGVEIAWTYTIRHGSSFCPHSEHQWGSSHNRPDWPSGG